MKVLFVCTGNICRSPFAERLFLAEAKKAGLRADASSAGTFTIAGERVPEPGLVVGREFGVELADHRSRLLEPALLEGVDLLVGMDRGHLEEVRALRAESGSLAKTVLLGSFDGGADEIGDPMGLDAAAFRKTYGRIAACVRGLVKRLRSVKRPRS